MDMMELTDSFHNFVNTPKKSLLTITDVHQYMTVSPTALICLLPASLEFMTVQHTYKAINTSLSATDSGNQ